jgi:hypothetical protein
MKYLLIKNETVENVIVWDGISNYDPGDYLLEPCPESVGIGWTRINGVWQEPQQEEQPK